MFVQKTTFVSTSLEFGPKIWLLATFQTSSYPALPRPHPLTLTLSLSHFLFLSLPLSVSLYPIFTHSISISEPHICLSPSPSLSLTHFFLSFTALISLIFSLLLSLSLILLLIQVYLCLFLPLSHTLSISLPSSFFTVSIPVNEPKICLFLSPYLSLSLSKGILALSICIYLLSVSSLFTF